MNQTYRNIEMFVIDDGSTDNTRDIVESYIEKFAKNGKILTYFYQNNVGVPGAINTGLKKISGEYLVFPDADDWYRSDDAISDLVNVFESSSKNVGAVRGMQYLINEKTMKIIDKKGDIKKNYPLNLAEQLLFNDKDWWWTSGSIMIRTDYFFNYYPNREICCYDSHGDRIRFGQNFQLLFPILYDFECITMNKYIYNVLTHRNSCSRKRYSYSEEIKRRGQLNDVCLSVLGLPLKMSGEGKNRLTQKRALKTDVSRFIMAFKFKQKFDCSVYYNKILIEDRKEAKVYKWRYLLSQMPFGFRIYRLYEFIKESISYIKRYYWLKCFKREYRK